MKRMVGSEGDVPDVHGLTESSVMLEAQFVKLAIHGRRISIWGQDCSKPPSTGALCRLPIVPADGDEERNDNLPQK